MTFLNAPSGDAERRAGVIQDQMKQVFDRQSARATLGRPPPNAEGTSPAPYGWARSVFYLGAIAAGQATGDRTYLETARRWAAAETWPVSPGLLRAEELVRGQACLALYDHEGRRDQALLKAVRASLGPWLAASPEEAEDWATPDVLFGFAPLLAHLGAITGDWRYLHLLDRLWWNASAFLYDRQEKLFFRNRTMLAAAGKGGVFGALANGWALAALARILTVLPAAFRGRPRFVGQLRAVAQAVAIHLCPVPGLWCPDLLHPGRFPEPDIGASALLAFGLVRGVNAGLLTRRRYEPIVHRAWRGIQVAMADADPPGPAPGLADRLEQARPEAIAAYSAGAFLMLGSEMMRLMAPGRKPPTA